MLRKFLVMSNRSSLWRSPSVLKVEGGWLRFSRGRGCQRTTIEASIENIEKKGRRRSKGNIVVMKKVDKEAFIGK